MTKQIKVEELDDMFDNGEDVMDHFDVRHPIIRNDGSVRRVSVDMPEWMIEQLDEEARHLAVPRQAIIKIWLSERLERQSQARQMS